MIKTDEIQVTCSLIPLKNKPPEPDALMELYTLIKGDNENFEEVVISLVKKHFNEALCLMMPALQTITINKIHIAISLAPSGSTLATYRTRQSDDIKGEYFFTANSTLIFEYILNYFIEDLSLSNAASTTWVHELIHMIDHRNLTELKYHPDKPDMVEAFVRLLLRFRNEGIAESYYLTKSHTHYRSIQAARTPFIKTMNVLRNWRWNDKNLIVKCHLLFNGDSRLYNVGAWMILHILGCREYPGYTPQAEIAAVKIKKRQPMTEDEIMSIVHKALAIDNLTFIQYLTKPGTDGKPFVSYSDLYDLARTVEIGRADIVRDWSRPTQLTGDPNIIRLFRIMRPVPEYF